MGGLNPGARSALVKLKLANLCGACGKGAALIGTKLWPATQAIQSWQLGQLLWWVVGSSSPVWDAHMGQSADMLTGVAASLTCVALSAWVAMTTPIMSADQPRTGSKAIMRMRRMWRMVFQRVG